MPTPDDPAAPRRRALGRGPGVAASPEPEPEPDSVPEPEREPVPGPGPERVPVAVAVGPDPVPEPEPAPGAWPAAAGPQPEPGAGPEAGGPEAAGPEAAAPEAAPETGDKRFTVRLVNFEGPFDLLLQLISKHKLDVTEVALSKVTDEFMAYIRAMGPDGDLDQTTEFLVVAATLLDLKAARLLPAAEVEDEADLALLEARDLLFARLLQYRAYKRIAEIFQGRLTSEARRHPRTVGLEDQYAELLPEVVISIGPEGFAKLAVKAMQPKPKPQVYVDHIHAPLVSVREQAGLVVERLRAAGEAVSFRTLTEDAPDTLTVVARFLALLELYREKAVTLDQDEALGDLLVAWCGGEGAEPVVTDEFDQELNGGTDEEGVRE
ncbi:segregation and condensation protein A [Streptomyces sundarbansensis]